MAVRVVNGTEFASQRGNESQFEDRENSTEFGFWLSQQIGRCAVNPTDYPTAATFSSS